MSLVNIEKAIRLPAPDVEALIQGRMIAAIVWRSFDPGEKYALYPADNSNMPLMQPKQMTLFPESGQLELPLVVLDKVLIKAWARCELCQMVNEPESLEALSRLTMWKTEALQQILQQRPFIFLTHLRVYLLPNPIEMSVQSSGNFVSLPKSLNVTDSTPVLSDTIFAKRRHQLEKLEPPEHPELEELQSALVHLSKTNSNAKQLDAKIQIFLGWSSHNLVKPIKPDLDWIKTIAALGNRTTELDTDKSNYQAGTDFENVVRDSLEFLGFTIDYAHKGGAGGLDLFCSKPYPLVGECKAGKKIPNDTAVQLLNLGTLRLRDPALLRRVTKLIIGPGEPTPQLKDAAQLHGMAIMNPETLEKLVELQSKYPNSVDLFKLKEYLKPGQSDDEVAKYIQQVEQEIKVRSQIVQAVKQLCDSDSEFPTVVEIKVQYNAKFATDFKLTEKSVKDLTIELSSPLTGYLGRREKKVDSESDRFYFLHDLLLDD